MTTYDQWKTTDPRDYEPELEPPQDDEPTELDLAYERIAGLEAELDASRKMIDQLTDRMFALLAGSRKMTAQIEAMVFFKST